MAFRLFYGLNVRLYSGDVFFGGQAALHVASENGDVLVIETLVHANATVDQLDR